MGGPQVVLMTRIAQCESGGTQFNPDGSVVKSHTADYGMYQINKTHIKEALSHGWDIMTVEGNTNEAMYLYSLHGTRDWSASKKCWNTS